MATDAPVSGTVVRLLGPFAQRLSPVTTPCRQITIRSHEGTGEISIGPAGVTAGDRWGFTLELETFDLGPFGAGQGLRPCDVYVVGTPGDYLTWSGVHA